MQRDNQTILLNLYKQSEVSSPNIVEGYKELNNFRQQVEIHPMGSQLYTRAKKKVKKYRTIFAALAVIFLLLSLFVSVTTPSYPMLFGTGVFFTARNLVAGLAICMGLTSSFCAFVLNPAKEAAQSVLTHNQLHLKRHFNRKKVDWHLSFSFWNRPCKKKALLEQKLSDIENKLLEKYHEVIHLLERIDQSDSLKESGREKLYNQALHEFVDQGRELVHTFNVLKLPYEVPSEKT